MRGVRELFSRIVFNILCSNNDDHARNHAAFWDGESLAQTPAYDICPQLRSGGETAQVMGKNEGAIKGYETLVSPNMLVVTPIHGKTSQVAAAFQAGKEGALRI